MAFWTARNWKALPKGVQVDRHRHQEDQADHRQKDGPAVHLDVGPADHRKGAVQDGPVANVEGQAGRPVEPLSRRADQRLVACCLRSHATLSR